MRDSSKMQDNCIISIIVPVYNVPKYLRRCLRSIQAQTFTQFETILVDDCSTDDSGEICDEFAKTDSRFRVIHKPVNEKLSAARNTGLKVARGKYIAYLDSDDYIHPQMYETLYKNIKKNDYDIAMCDFEKTCEDNYKFYPVSDKLSYRTLSVEQFILGPYWNLYYAVVWNKLYKRELVDGIQFRKGVYVEDQFYNIQVFKRRPSVICCNFNGVAYFQRADSLAHTNRPLKDVERIENTLMNFDVASEMCSKNQVVKARLLWRMMILMVQLKNNKTTYKQKRQSVISSYEKFILPDFMHSRTVSITHKLAIGTMLKVPKVYPFLVKSFYKIHKLKSTVALFSF